MKIVKSYFVALGFLASFTASADIVDIDEGKTEISVIGRLISAYYQSPGYADNKDLTLVFNIKISKTENKHVAFTGEEIKIAAPMISSLGKEIVITQMKVAGQNSYSVQVIEPKK